MSKIRKFRENTDQQYAGRLISGISILQGPEIQAFQSSGRIPIAFRMNEDGQPIPEYQHQAGKGKFQSIHRVIKDANLWYLYLRHDLCSRGVDRKADDAFRKPFKVRLLDAEGKEVETHSALEMIKELNAKLKVRERFREAFKSKRLFGLGIVVLALNDGMTVETKATAAEDIAFLRTFWRIDLDKIEGDDYIVKVAKHEGGQFVAETLKIHKSRVIRVCSDNTMYGIGETTPLYNILEGLMNVDWAAFETYFAMASPILTLIWQGELESTNEDQLDYLEEQMKTVTVDKRFIIPSKYEFKYVGPESDIPDPGKWWEWLIKRISAGYGVPYHILMGVEAGQKLGVENTLQQYYADVANDQSPFLEDVLIGFYERLRDLGIIPGWEDLKLDIVWEPLWEESLREQWESNKLKAEAGKTVVDGQILTPEEAYIWMKDGKWPERVTADTPLIGEFRIAAPALPFGADDIRGDEDTPHRILEIQTVRLENQLKPVVQGLIDGDYTREAADRLFDRAFDQMRLQIEEHAMGDLLRRIPLEARGQVVSLPPEYEADIQREIDRIKEYAKGILDDADALSPIT